VRNGDTEDCVRKAETRDRQRKEREKKYILIPKRDRENMKRGIGREKRGREMVIAKAEW